MATVTLFTPTSAGPFEFGATLDGQNYVCTVKWNLWAQRWYLEIADTAGTLIVSRALIASPPQPYRGVNLLFGYFQTSIMAFYDAQQTFVVMP
jgi:hypothetical protein